MLQLIYFDAKSQKINSLCLIFPILLTRENLTGGIHFGDFRTGCLPELLYFRTGRMRYLFADSLTPDVKKSAYKDVKDIYDHVNILSVSISIMCMPK